MSGILRYFHLVKEPSSSEAAGLPDPNGPLSKVIPSSTIAAANENICAIGKTGAASKTPYLHLTAAQKYQVGKEQQSLERQTLYVIMQDVSQVFH